VVRLKAPRNQRIKLAKTDSFGNIDEVMGVINGKNVGDMRKKIRLRRKKQRGHMTLRRRTVALAKLKEEAERGSNDVIKPEI